MRKLKILSFIMAITMILGAFMTSFAQSFKDVSSSNYSWAVDAIESMAKDKTILGYEDGTFRPANTVTKLESLVLAARILGVNDSANKDFINAIEEIYKDSVSTYDVAYGQTELEYLLAKGFLTSTELSEYVGKTNATQGLKRYELAVLLTKAMGAEDEVKKNLVSVLEYEDESQIPSFAKKYVEYVTEKGLMQGISATEFSPNTTVTRAQMAVVLYKIKNLAKFKHYSAIVSTIDPLLGVIKLKSKDDEQFGYTIKDNVELRFEGKSITVNDISIGYECVVTTMGDSLFSIDFITPDVEETLKASITSINKNAKTGTVLKLSKFLDNGSKENVEYAVSDSIVVSYQGKSATMTDLSVGDYVEVTVKKGKITVISAKPKNETVKGTVTDIHTSDLGVVVKIDTTDDDEVSCTASNEVTVNKNGDSKASLSDILVGDSVSVTLEYGYISKIIASSKTSNNTGFIEAINISSSPSVTVKLNSESKTYKLASNVSILVNGVAGTIYDLRLSTTAKITLESNTIVKIETSPVETVTQITGTVDLVNVSYGLIQITYYDSTMAQNITQSVFAGSGTKIINNSTGKEATLKTLTAGQSVTAIGSIKSGVFEASTVILLG